MKALLVLLALFLGGTCSAQSLPLYPCASGTSNTCISGVISEVGSVQILGDEVDYFLIVFSDGVHAPVNYYMFPKLQGLELVFSDAYARSAWITSNFSSTT